MTGGGDTDEFEDQSFDESDDVADEDEDVDLGDDLPLNESDPDPTAGASDIGGRAGDDEGSTDR